MGKYKKRSPDPSRDEISRKCLEIQDSWDERTRSSRSVYRRKPWVAPVESVGNLNWHSDSDLTDGVWIFRE